MDILSEDKIKLDFHMNDLRNIMKLPNILKAFIDKIERQDLQIARLQAELSTKATSSALEQTRIELQSDIADVRDELRKESQLLKEDVDTRATKGELEVGCFSAFGSSSASFVKKVSQIRFPSCYLTLCKGGAIRAPRCSFCPCS